MTRDAPPSKSRIPNKASSTVGPQSSAPTATSHWPHHSASARASDARGASFTCHAAIVPTRFSTGLHARFAL